MNLDPATAQQVTQLARQYNVTPERLITIAVERFIANLLNDSPNAAQFIELH
jgi:hypothetical protein